MKHYTAISICLSVIFLPQCAYQQVSYKQDIEPILDVKCISCHTSPDGIGYKATGLRFDSYENLMYGTIYGPVVVAGDSRRSILNMLVEGRAGNLKRFLHEDEKSLTEDEVAKLRYWVDQGAMKN